MIPRLSKAIGLAWLTAACARGPVDWDDVAFAAPPPQASQPKGPPRAGTCPESAAFVATPSSAVVGAFWQLRPDSSAVLMGATSAGDGPGWRYAVIDSADAGRSGCGRAAPGVYVNGDNVHVVYSMNAREGPGIFFAHSMDRGATFHSPVPVVYGEKPGRASVAADGDLVIVAYEDPNTTPTRISVAVSTTQGHLFEFRQVLSPAGRAAAAPWVETRADGVTVGWSVPADSTAFARRGRITVRAQ